MLVIVGISLLISVIILLVFRSVYSPSSGSSEEDKESSQMNMYANCGVFLISFIVSGLLQYLLSGVGGGKSKGSKLYKMVVGGGRDPYGGMIDEIEIGEAPF